MTNFDSKPSKKKMSLAKQRELKAQLPELDKMDMAVDLAKLNKDVGVILKGLSKGYLLYKEDVKWIEIVHSLSPLSKDKKVGTSALEGIDAAFKKFKKEELPSIALMDTYELWIDAGFIDADLNVLK